MSVTTVTADWLRGQPLPGHAGAQDKQARGTVLVAGGCLEVPGAVLLAGQAALRSGAGRLQLASCAGLALGLGLAMPEARVIALPETADGQIAAAAAARLHRQATAAQALVLGPGMMRDDDTLPLLQALLQDAASLPPMVLDAAMLSCLAECPDLLRGLGGRAVLTPHAGEMAGLLGIERSAVEADPLAAARRAAAMLQAVVVMKGACSRIVTPQGEAFAYGEGNIGLATSGSGDTLAGVIGGLLARGATPLRATLWGVFLHGEAGGRLARRIGPLGFLARELPDELPGLMAELCAEPG